MPDGSLTLISATDGRTQAADGSPYWSKEALAAFLAPRRATYHSRARVKNLAKLDNYVACQIAAAKRLGGVEGDAYLRRAIAHVQQMVGQMLDANAPQNGLVGLTAIDLSNAISGLEAARDPAFAA